MENLASPIVIHIDIIHYTFLNGHVREIRHHQDQIRHPKPPFFLALERTRRSSNRPNRFLLRLLRWDAVFFGLEAAATFGDLEIATGAFFGFTTFSSALAFHDRSKTVITFSGRLELWLTGPETGITEWKYTPKRIQTTISSSKLIYRTNRWAKIKFGWWWQQQTITLDKCRLEGSLLFIPPDSMGLSWHLMTICSFSFNQSIYMWR